MAQVALIGQVTRDLVGGDARLGGPVLYGARAFLAAGADFVAAAKCGAEEAAELAALGLPVECVAAAAVPAFAFGYDGDVRRMEIAGLGDAWIPADVEALAVEAEWVQLGAALRGDFSVETLAALGSGPRLAFDAHGLARARRVGPLTLDGDFDRALLPPLTVLKLAQEEALAVAGGVEPERVSALGVPEALVTYGSRGAEIVTGGRGEWVDAHATAGADPTGAGDSFLAGYVAARAGAAEPVEAARAAALLVAQLLDA